MVGFDLLISKSTLPCTCADLTGLLLLRLQSITTYASNTGNGTAVYYPHYELDLGYTGLTPDIVNNTGSYLSPCGSCWNGYLITCAS